MTAGALKRACHHVCKQPRSAPLNPQTWLYGVSSRMGGERRAGCQERAGAGVAQSGGCHIRGQHMPPPRQAFYYCCGNSDSALRRARGQSAHYQEADLLIPRQARRLLLSRLGPTTPPTAILLAGDARIVLSGGACRRRSPSVSIHKVLLSTCEVSQALQALSWCPRPSS